MTRRHIATLLLLAGAYALALEITAQSTQVPVPAGASISAEDLRRDVYEIASRDMEGRLVGTEGNRRVVRFIEDRFERLGLRAPAGTDRFLQPFDLVTVSLGGLQALTISTPIDEVSGELGTGFFPARFSGSGRAEGSVVFVGFGISAPDLDHDDYRSVDVRGHVVLVLDHEPEEFDPTSVFDGSYRSEHSRAVRKALEAQRRGAVAVVFISDVHNHRAYNGRSAQPFDADMRRTWPTGDSRMPIYQLGSWVSKVRIPVVRLAPHLVERVFDSIDVRIASLSARAETPGGILDSGSLDLSMTVDTTVQRATTAVHNVVALLDGTDPLVRDEWIVVCGHLDHEGSSPEGVFQGADDNASGVAGVLEIAEAFANAARAGDRPRRSVLFAAWNAEERGLFGAWNYTENPLTPLERTVAVLNMDMIGRHEEVPENGGWRFRGLRPQTAAANRNAVNFLGYSYSTDLRKAVESANAQTRLDLRFRYDNNRSNLLRRSDHWPFLFHRVPALFIHTGLHPDYHTTNDVPEKLDYDKMSRVVTLVHQLAWRLAQAEDRPRFD